MNFVAYCVFLAKLGIIMVLHEFNLTYYSSIILGSFCILLFQKLCWHIGLTPNDNQLTVHTLWLEKSKYVVSYIIAFYHISHSFRHQKYIVS